MSKKNMQLFPHTSYICVGGDSPKKWDSLTVEEKNKYSDRIMENIGKTLSHYFSENPNEADFLLQNQPDFENKQL